MPPQGRAELHFHLLPGVDDGPSDMAESLEVARAAIADGTSVIVSTPHVRDVVVAELPGRVAELRAVLRRERIALEVLCGGELESADAEGLSDAELDIVAQGPPGRRWGLLEAPLFDPRHEPLVEACAALRRRGLGVLMAHPERAPWPLDVLLGVLAAEREAGTRFQLNATSITGRHGDEVRARALELVRRDLADAVSSDAHRPTRGPLLTRTHEALLAMGVAEQAARRLVDTGPRELLERGIELGGPGPGAAGRMRGPPPFRP